LREIFADFKKKDLNTSYFMLDNKKMEKRGYFVFASIFLLVLSVGFVSAFNLPNWMKNVIGTGSSSGITGNVVDGTVFEDADGCTDSDGGAFFYTKGTTRGKSSSGFVRDYPDICVGSNVSFDGVLRQARVREYWCGNEGFVNFTSKDGGDYTCPEGCVDGACYNSGANVPVPTPVTNINCVDSDGGIDEFIYGFTNFTSGTFNLVNKDSCVVVAGYDSKGNPIGWQSTGSCSGSDCFVQEAYCQTSPPDADASELTKCPNGCSNGACLTTPAPTQQVCQRLIDKVTNPSDFSDQGYQYYIGSNWSYSGTWWINGKTENYREYSSHWYTNNYESDNYRYQTIQIGVSVFDNKNVDLKAVLDDQIAYNLCQIQEYYDHRNQVNKVYVCNWDALRDRQDINNFDYKSRQVVWFNDNVLVWVNVYQGSQLSDAEVSKIALERVNDYISDLKDNRFKYANWNDFYIEYPVSDQVYQSLSQCSSDIPYPVRQGTNESCYPSWSCKVEPVVCPEYGYQKRICIDYGCNMPAREEQIYCSPGVCSGCYVPRWLGAVGENICLPYGTRFENVIGFTLENVTLNDQDTTTISVRELNGDGDGAALEVYANNTARIELFVDYNKSISIYLEKGKVYDWDEIISQVVEGEINYESSLFVDEIFYDAQDYDSSYITVTFSVEQTREREVKESFNAYCNYDGQVNVQRSGWGACQNNYECESNLCSSGQCVDVQAVAREVGAFRNFIARMLCRLTNLFSDQGYNSCLADALGY